MSQKTSINIFFRQKLIKMSNPDALKWDSRSALTLCPVIKGTIAVPWAMPVSMPASRASSRTIQSMVEMHPAKSERQGRGIAKLAEQTPIWAELSKNHTTDKTMTICHPLTASHLTDLV